MDKEQQPITVTLPNGKIASSVVDLVVRKKPIGWSRKSCSPYYKEVYGDWLRVSLDDMIKTRRDKVFPYANFPKISHTSLYLRVNQAWRYIVDYQDPDGKYAKLHREVKLDRSSKIGVVLSFDEVIEGGNRAEDFVSHAEAPKWRREMDEYLEEPNPDGQPWHKDKLLLSNEEVEQLNLELGGLSNVMFVVTNREIKIVKGI